MDTSTTISALIGGWFTQLISAVDGDRLQLVCSEDLLAELADVLTRPIIRAKISEDAAALFRNLYAQRALFFEPAPNPLVCRDPRDDYLLALSTASAADYLVTRDEDLLVLQRYGATEIIFPARFLQILAGLG